MSILDDYPGVSHFKDRHGKLRFRYRLKGKTKSLPGLPGDLDFGIAYQAAKVAFGSGASLRAPPEIRQAPRTLGFAWRLVIRSPEWKVLDPATHYQQIALAEEFLSDRVVAGKTTSWAEIPVEEVKRKHIKSILADRIATPHKAKHLLTVIRKMIYASIDEEWIEHDPTMRVKWRPKYKGWRSWSIEEVVKYQERWPAGSKQRTVFSLALWLGIRRSDIPNLKWDCVNFIRREVKTNIVKGHKLPNGTFHRLKMSTMLLEDLMAIGNRDEYVLTTEYGKPFSIKSITNSMQEWTRKADIPPGCTIHGLRKTLGKWATEGGATTRMAMELLGHDDIEHVELYSRDADQAKLAAEALDCAVTAYERHLKFM